MMIPTPQKGQAISTWARLLTQYLRSERVVQGNGILVNQTPGGKTLSTISSASSTFSGAVYVSGNRFVDSDKTTLSGTAITDNSTDSAKAWVKVAIGASTFAVTYEDGPPSIPFPANEEWYQVASTAGDIHCDRF